MLDCPHVDPASHRCRACGVTRKEIVEGERRIACIERPAAPRKRRPLRMLETMALEIANRPDLSETD